MAKIAKGLEGVKAVNEALQLRRLRWGNPNEDDAWYENRIDRKPVEYHMKMHRYWSVPSFLLVGYLAYRGATCVNQQAGLKACEEIETYIGNQLQDLEFTDDE